ncbi:hypothetical protein D3C80_1621770 [compost metagenome]
MLHRRAHHRCGVAFGRGQNAVGVGKRLGAADLPDYLGVGLAFEPALPDRTADLLDLGFRPVFDERVEQLSASIALDAERVLEGCGLECLERRHCRIEVNTDRQRVG